MSIQICLPEEKLFAIPSTSACGAQQCDIAMIDEFLDRELEDWLVSSVSDQPDGASHVMEPKFVVPSFILSDTDGCSEPYPLTFSDLLKEEQSSRDINDLKISQDYGTSEKNDETTRYYLCPEESSGIDLQQQNMELGCEKRADVESGNSARSRRFREYQDKQWQEMFQGLLSYIKMRGHCCVPNKLQENPRLGRWVKRQRHQYKLLQQGKQSTLTASRVDALEEVGFVWDSHAALWVERLSELKEYRKVNGHCNVPSTYRENVQLSTWVKCQRRQYKIYMSDKKTSNLTAERIMALEKLGFEWYGRLVRSNVRQLQKS